MANFFLSLCLLALLLNGSTAQFGFGRSPWQSSRQGAQKQCRLERLSALEPRKRVQSEGGVTEYFDENEQLNCAGVSAIRMTIQPQGLSLPTYFNAPQLIYVVKGRGIAGGVIPGCPETFQSISGQQQQEQGREQQQEEQGQGQGRQEQQQREEQGQGRHEQQQQREEQGQGRQEQQQREKQGQGRHEQQQQREEQGQGRHEQQQQREEQGQEQQQQRQRASGDQHQRIIRFNQGDILAVPAGMAQWCYNDGDSPVVVVKVLDTSNNANQLDNNPRKFSLAGQTSEQDERSAKNIFSGFNLQFLADALGVSRELTKKLHQGQKDEIIRVQRGLRVVMPPRSDREEQEGRQSEGQQSEGRQSENGLEQVFCTLKLRENIDEPSRADVYNPQAGRLSHLNAQKLPVLNLIQMSAARGVLYRGATLAPHWNVNAHTALYVTGGRGRIQIVGDKGRSLLDQELREGQMVVIP